MKKIRKISTSLALAIYKKYSIWTAQSTFLIYFRLNLLSLLVSGKTYFEMKDFHSAKEVYSRALEIDPTNKAINAKLYFNRGLVSYRLKSYDDGIRDCLNALTLNSKNGKAFLIIGHCFLEKRMYETALVHYRQALEYKNDEEVSNAISNAERLLQLWKTDDYFVLGLKPPSSIVEVIAAMKKMSKSYHPDRFSDNDEKKSHQEVFKRITEAKENLVREMDDTHEWVPEPSPQPFPFNLFD